MKFSFMMSVFCLLGNASLLAIEEKGAFDSKSKRAFFERVVGASISIHGEVERVVEVDGGREILLVDSPLRIHIPATVFAANVEAFGALDRFVVRPIWAHGGCSTPLPSGFGDASGGR